VDNPLADVTLGTNEDGQPIIVDGIAQRNFNLHEISTLRNTGLFALSDLSFYDFNLLLGARYDNFDVESEDIAETLLGIRFDSVTASEGKQKNEEDAYSFNTSLSYNFDFGLIPYVTYSESKSLSTNQLGGIIPGTVADGSFLQDSELFEAGIKFEGLEGRLYAALTYYDQEKSEQSGQTQALTQVFAEGYELEVRAVVSDSLSIVGTATNSETTEIGDRIFTVINGADFVSQNPDAYGDAGPEAVYGGRISGDRATFVGSGAELERGGLPDNIVSLFGSYLFEFSESDLTATLGFTWVDETSIDVFDSVILPSYMVFNGSLRYETDRTVTLLQINNLTNEKILYLCRLVRFRGCETLGR